MAPVPPLTKATIPVTLLAVIAESAKGILDKGLDDNSKKLAHLLVGSSATFNDLLLFDQLIEAYEIA